MPTVSKQKLAIAAIERIEDKIYVVRGQRVMLGSDLAAVRRNRNRFPVDFMFELSDDEVADLASSRSQTVILKRGSRRGKNIKFPPFAFTEHGAVMLASVLKSHTAIEASIAVVRAFTRMRSILALHKDLAKRIDQLAKVAARHQNDFQCRVPSAERDHGRSEIFET